MAPSLLFALLLTVTPVRAEDSPPATGEIPSPIVAAPDQGATAPTPTPAQPISSDGRVPARFRPDAAPRQSLALAPRLPSRWVPPWDVEDLGVVDPRQAGCLSRVPGLPVTPGCRLALESRYGPRAVQPVQRVDSAERAGGRHQGRDDGR